MALQFKPRNTVRARALRNEATPAERKLWGYLSGSQVNGYKFSRQMPIGAYFCDFLCRQRKLIIELDGYSHDLSLEHDAARTRYLEAEGYTVIRFSNDEVLSNVEGVVTSIAQVLGGLPTPDPSRLREGS